MFRQDGARRGPDLKGPLGGLFDSPALHPQAFGAVAFPQQLGLACASQHVCSNSESQHADDGVGDVGLVIQPPFNLQFSRRRHGHLDSVASFFLQRRL